MVQFWFLFFLNFPKAFDFAYTIKSFLKSFLHMAFVVLLWFGSGHIYPKEYRRYPSLTKLLKVVWLIVVSRRVRFQVLYGFDFHDWFSNSSTFFEFTLFADDSTFTYSIKNTPTDRLACIKPKGLFSTNKWLKTNKIKVSVSKTNTSYFYIENIFFSSQHPTWLRKHKSNV